MFPLAALPQVADRPIVVCNSEVIIWATCRTQSDTLCATGGSPISHICREDGEGEEA